MCFAVFTRTVLASTPAPAEPSATETGSYDHFFNDLRRATEAATTIVTGTLSNRRVAGEGTYAVHTLYDLHVQEVIAAEPGLSIGQTIVVSHPLMMEPDSGGILTVSSHGGAPKYLPQDATVVFMGNLMEAGPQYFPIMEHYSFFIREVEPGGEFVASTRWAGSRYLRRPDGTCFPFLFADKIPERHRPPNDPTYIEERRQTPPSDATLLSWSDLRTLLHRLRASSRGPTPSP